MKNLKVIKLNPDRNVGKYQKVDRLYSVVSVWRDGGEEEWFCPHSIPRLKPVNVFSKQAGVICLHDKFNHEYKDMMTRKEAFNLAKDVKDKFRKFGMEKKVIVIDIPLPINWHEYYPKVIKKIPMSLVG